MKYSTDVKLSNESAAFCVFSGESFHKAIPLYNGLLSTLVVVVNTCLNLTFVELRVITCV